jgi:hypothetical protein
MTVGLHVELSLSSSSRVQGEQFEVSASVLNTNNSPRTLVVDAQDAPLTYLLDYLGQDGQGERPTESLRVSKSVFRTSLFSGPWDSEYKTTQQEVAPGAAIYFNDDLTAYLTAPLLPGQYGIKAMYVLDGVANYSETAPFEILPPKVGSFEQLLSPMDGFTSGLYDHKLTEGSWAIFQQASQTDSPTTSIAHRRASLNAPVTDLALACPLEDGPWGQWFGWLNDGELSAAYCSNNVELGGIVRAGIPLEEPQIAKPGFQLTDQSALFVISGIREGEHIFQLARFLDDSATLVSEDFLTTPPSGQVLARYIPNDVGDHICLVWAEERDSSHCLMTAKLDCGGKGLLGPAEVIHQSDERFLCYEIGCYDGEGVGYVNVLTGSGKSLEDITYLRTSLNPHDLTYEAHTLKAPLPPVHEWAIASAAHGAMPIVASTKDAVIYTDAEAPIFWVSLAKDQDNPSHLRMTAANSRSPLVSYFDATAGRVFQKVEADLLFGGQDTEFDMESPPDDFKL